MPRVISGRFKGTRLLAPKGDRTRPTSDKVKEALFSIIHARIPGSSFLDLYAGSGQIGIEAVSRGAYEAVLVEQSRAVTDIIRLNIEKVHAGNTISVWSSDVFSALRKLGESKHRFDLIFMDPPYAEAAAAFRKAVTIIHQYDLLKEDGLLIVEHSSDSGIEENVINLTLSRRCKYGLTLLTFYNRYNDTGGTVRSEDLSVPREL